MVPHEFDKLVEHVGFGNQIELGFRLCEDRPQGKFALERHQIGQNSFVGGVVEQKVGWLIVLGNTYRRMTPELRITLQKNALAAGRFDSVDEVLL